MINYIKNVLYLSLFLMLNFACFSNGASSFKVSADTVINNNQLTVRYHYNLDTVRHPVILETSCIMVTDSMEKLKEFGALHEHWKRRDSLINYINPAELDSLNIKQYSQVNNVLTLDVFYPTQAMWYFAGAMNFDGKGNLTLSFGDRKVVTQYSIPPRNSRIRFRIFIPKGYAVHELTFRYS